LVQSSHKSCEYLVEAINNFLVDTREKIKTVTEEEFEVQKQAVITKLAVKENGRFFNEIASHEYLFDRQDVEIETVKSITLNEFMSHFEFVFFSDQVKRVDIELTSTAHAE
jgi:secreted Zn-dependent insulinase-like peptidase